MANDILSQLNTKDLADRFNNFLSNQGLGEMNPSSSARYRQGVEASPMDEILALNNLSLDELFRRLYPEAPPLADLQQSPALDSFNLSEKSLLILASLNQGTASAESIQVLIGELLEVLPDFKNPEDLLRALLSLYSMGGDTPLLNGNNFTSTLIDLLKEMNTSASASLLQALRASPWILNQALSDPITGITSPLGFTTSLIKLDDVSSTDPITGTSQSETLVASRLGGTRMTGGGGKDLFLMPLNTNPFAEMVTIVDFDNSSGSKLVLDIRDYSKKFEFSFKIAKNSRRARKLARSRTSIIFNSQTSELLFNENAKRRGLGQNGGSVLRLENGSQLTSNDLLLLRDDGLWQLDGIRFLDI